MCRQFYRHCRDCHEPFRMAEPDMRETCDAFDEAQAIKPFLTRCPGFEVQLIRGPSGHGAKVCERCSKVNHNEQRKRENAQKRARRARVKRDKMTAGIGPGNVVWTPPHTRTPNSVHTQTLALHSPQARPQARPNVLSVSSMTQAQHQYGLNGSISTATMAQYLIKSEAYHESRQSLTTTMSNVLQPQENGYDRIATEVRDDSQLHRQYNQQYLPTPKSGVPLPTPKSDVPLPTTEPDVPLPTIEPDIYLPTPKPEVNHPTTSQGSPLPTKLDDTQQQDPPLGLGIIIPNDTKQKQNHAETSYFNDWFFQLTEWSTVFEDSDGPDDGKEL